MVCDEVYEPGAGLTVGVPTCIVYVRPFTPLGVHPLLNPRALSVSDCVTAGTVAVTQSLTLKARGFRSGWTPSGVNGRTYTMQVGTPTVSPAPGSYTSSHTITVSDVTTGAELHYTINSLEPTQAD